MRSRWVFVPAGPRSAWSPLSPLHPVCPGGPMKPWHPRSPWGPGGPERGNRNTHCSSTHLFLSERPDSLTIAKPEPESHLGAQRLQEAPCLQLDQDNSQSLLHHLKHKHKVYRGKGKTLVSPSWRDAESNSSISPLGPEHPWCPGLPGWPGHPGSPCNIRHIEINNS